MTPREFLENLFEFENCDECHMGANGHVAILLNFGHYGQNYFARCVGAQRERQAMKDTARGIN